MEKAVCLGKNYLDHALEMKDGIPDKAVLFLKPHSSCRHVARVGENVVSWFPLGQGALHHECEIVLRVARHCFQLKQAEASLAFDAVALGLDMTLRDLQREQKNGGLPWEVAKAFPDSGWIGPWHPVTSDFLHRPFSLTVDGQMRQKARGEDMRILPEQAIVIASQHFILRPGDVIFTGTPAGVGPVNDGSQAVLAWGDEEQFRIRWDSKKDVLAAR
jgi:2-keto-4-pentenoate hydratase/2-oxohepta-3-ene-1,7-dioic acid hydratase in catechol pathway